MHIAIVTVGILIALGLDGLREHYRERKLVRETRASFSREFEVDRTHAGYELKSVSAGRDTLEKIVAAMPALAIEHPDQLHGQLERIENPYYFFAANSWQAALSTGALAHMSPEEVAAYADATEGIHRYSETQAVALQAENRAMSMVRAHPHPTPEQAAAETEALLSFYRMEKAMAWVCPQMEDGIETAIRASANH